ncbi:hypothetical protein THAOC_13451 [Thalassiosira oceanica]|uniref:Uncharacterized protein n=1 Tax=Thalassiosira oceanica TaxID=159749 RepID=K0SXG8_THAOC|nr:hypothetical protein THAOC_13451 [Thalassiosira oceanica]|mmetsp:Transcript_32885/g.78540  ORF Transcript_32885/g.78540 Transcript_32885/m.78540 type:complete len:251 (-) Transcript_32885:859-1611(-)|eukprot:EJK65671.1 hypothetical protein THAOC_13451 [Thalassiosira oceanica]
MSSHICPFSLRELAAFDGLELAVIHEKNPLASSADASVGACHSCGLEDLVAYLHDGSGSKMCPVSQAFAVSYVCDKPASRSLSGITMGKSDTAFEVICFRHGAISYFLSAQNSCRATTRIANVLNIDEQRMKIILKGKVIYPNKNGDGNLDDVSGQILSVSKTDIIQHKKRPSLVVMGSRNSRSDLGSTAQSRSSLAATMFSFASFLAPSSLVNLTVNFIRKMLNCTATVFGAGWLFAKSIISPPNRRNE